MAWQDFEPEFFKDTVVHNNDYYVKESLSAPGNGIDWIVEHLRGRICIDLDIDRQEITRFGSPAQIDALIREEVAKIGSKEGGLMMIYGLYPGVPLNNVKALMDAMEKYATYYS